MGTDIPLAAPVTMDVGAIAGRWSLLGRWVAVAAPSTLYWDSQLGVRLILLEETSGCPDFESH